MVDLSVIVCSHNPRPNYLRRVFESLRNQTLSFEKWELLLVDNASTERLAPAWDLSWQPNARHIFEHQLGLAFARERGIHEASAELLVFVDDDNLLDPDYLAEVVKISREWPRLGVWGSGSILPEFELEPQHYLDELVPYLALRVVDKTYWSNVPTCILATPWGAGLCSRADVARTYCQMSNHSLIHLSGRSGKSVGSLMSGEDVEFSYVACSMGLGMAIFPSLKLIHLVPKERSAEPYLLRLYEGILTSHYLLDFKWRGTLPRDPFSFVGLAAMIANYFLLRGIKRRMYFARKMASQKALKIVKGTSPTALPKDVSTIDP